MYIYALLDPRTHEIRYIGKAINIANRLSSHLTAARSGRRNDYKDRWIRSLLEEELLPVATALIQTDQEHWQEDERFIIAGLRSAGVMLTNTTAGGEGVDIPHTKEWHAKIGLAHKGRTLSDERKEQIRKTLIAKTTHCPQGHEYTPENTAYGIKDGRPYRSCKQCRRDQAEKKRRKNGVVPNDQCVRKKEFCHRGHPMSGENLRILNRGDHVERICRECVRIRNRAVDARKRARQ